VCSDQKCCAYVFAVGCRSIADVFVAVDNLPDFFSVKQLCADKVFCEVLVMLLCAE